MGMTREELKAHCERQIHMCETWAILKGEEPHGKVYEEHKLILELLENEQEPCEDSVSRKAVEDLIYEECSGTKLDIDFAKVLLLQRAVKALKPVVPIRSKGHWDIKDNMWWVCSACGCQTRMMKKYNVPNFCPACGAKMVKPQESEASDA